MRLLTDLKRQVSYESGATEELIFISSVGSGPDFGRWFVPAACFPHSHGLGPTSCWNPVLWESCRSGASEGGQSGRVDFWGYE